MSKKETRSTGATVERADAENEIRQISFPGFDFITAAPAGQGKIASLLGVGQGAALTIKDLCRITGCDNRAVRLGIQRERLAGIPVCSDNAHGYFLPANDAERAACVRSLRHRASEINRVASALEKARGNQ